MGVSTNFFHPQHSHLIQALLLWSPFYRWGNWDFGSPRGRTGCLTTEPGQLTARPFCLLTAVWRQTDSRDPGPGLNSGQAAVWQKKGQKGCRALKEMLIWPLASAVWCGREVGEEKKWCPWIRLAQACITCGKMAAWMSWAPEHHTTHSFSSAEKPLCHVLPNEPVSH